MRRGSSGIGVAVASAVVLTLGTGCTCGASEVPIVEGSAEASAPGETAAPGASSGSGDSVDDAPTHAAVPDPDPRRIAALVATRPPATVHRCDETVVVAMSDGRVGALARDEDTLTLDIWTSMAPPARFIGCVGDAVVFVDTGDTRVVIRDVATRRDVGSTTVEGRVVDVHAGPDAGDLWAIVRGEEDTRAVLFDATSPTLDARGSLALGPTPIGFVSVDGTSGDEALLVPDFRGRRVDALTIGAAGEPVTQTHEVPVRPVGLVVVDGVARLRSMNGTEAPVVASDERADASWPWPVSLALETPSGLWIHGSSTARLARVAADTLTVEAELEDLPDVVELVALDPYVVAVRAGQDPALVFIDGATATIAAVASLDTAPSGAIALDDGIAVLLPESNRVELWSRPDGSDAP